MIGSRRFLRCLLLAVASGWIAEILLGDLWLTGFPGPGQQIAELVLFACYYGSAAILLREIAVRTRRGWATVVCLALVHGVLEEGFVDQSLFDPHFAGLDLLSYGHIGWLGTGVPWAVFVLTLHAVWSITVPIVLVQQLTGRGDAQQLREPWIRPAGLMAVPAALYLASAAAVYADSVSTSGYRLTGTQAIATIVAIIVGLLFAFAVFQSNPSATATGRPRTGRTLAVAAAVGLVATTGFAISQMAMRPSVPALVTVLSMLTCLAIGIVLARRYRLEAFGLAIGALATYAWMGIQAALGQSGAAVVEQALIVAVTAGVVALAVRRWFQLTPDELPTRPTADLERQPTPGPHLR